MNRQHENNERRMSGRMDIARDLHYRILSRSNAEPESCGTTVNMSSSGVLFTAKEALIPGKRVEISVDWPAQLNSTCALKLVARGRIVRFDGEYAALEILQHEFRTRKIKP